MSRNVKRINSHTVFLKCWRLKGSVLAAVRTHNLQVVSTRPVGSKSSGIGQDGMGRRRHRHRVPPGRTSASTVAFLWSKMRARGLFDDGHRISQHCADGRTDGRTTTESAKTAKELSQVGFAQVRNDFLQSRALNAGQELNQRKISGLLCSVDRVLVLAWERENRFYFNVVTSARKQVQRTRRWR